MLTLCLTQVILGLNDLDLKILWARGQGCHHNPFKTIKKKIGPLVFEI
jgi:hypothetical protein